MPNLKAVTAIKILVILTVISFILGIVVIFVFHLSRVDSILDYKITRIKNDLQYKNGKWNITPYENDLLAYASASTYVITTDGFIIDSTNSIQGFLDTSDFRYQNSFTTPQTIRTLTDQKWRMFSHLVSKSGKTLGVITVGYYNPREEELSEIDTELRTYQSIISKSIHINGDRIAASGIDERLFSKQVAYNVVDQFNLVVAKKMSNGLSLPSLIDTSYLRPLLQGRQKLFKYDKRSGFLYRVKTDIKYDSQQNPIAVIATGLSINEIIELTKYFVIMQGIVVLCSAGLLLLVLKNNTNQSINRSVPKKIMFNEKESVLIIDSQRLSVPYDTNQFYLLRTIFSKPEKAWETDELLENIGEDPTESHWRKVYDTMAVINKKVIAMGGFRLIINKDKRYMLNPDLVSSTSKT